MSASKNEMNQSDVFLWKAPTILIPEKMCMNFKTLPHLSGNYSYLTDTPFTHF